MNTRRIAKSSPHILNISSVIDVTKGFVSFEDVPIEIRTIIKEFETILVVVTFDNAA